jgi:ubiquinone/menaquinone biosynthesis C-methylase UbiE
MSSSQPDSIVSLFESLSDKTRLRLLHLLEGNEIGVAELCEIVQLPQSTVSRHLRVLSDLKWLSSRREGAAHFYRLILDELDDEARKLWLLTRDQTKSWTAVHQDELRLERVLRDRQSETQNFFAGAAGEWDRLREEMYGSLFTQSAILSLLPEEFTVADLGCGTGEIAALLAPHVKKVIAVDNSAAMLKAARKRLGEQGNVELHRAQLESLPIESGSCDAALLILVLSYVDDPGVVLKEIARILKPGGKLVLVDLLAHDREDFRRQMNQRHAGFSPEMLKSLLTGGGFASDAVVITPLPPEPQSKGPALFLATATKPAG